jgi:hypothetical protein
VININVGVSGSICLAQLYDIMADDIDMAYGLSSRCQRCLGGVCGQLRRRVAGAFLKSALALLQHGVSAARNVTIFVYRNGGQPTAVNQA